MKPFLLFAMLVFWGEVAGQKITFYKDIQPIFHARCSPCHRPGGGAPFSLITYDDVSRSMYRISLVMKS